MFSIVNIVSCKAKKIVKKILILAQYVAKREAGNLALEILGVGIAEQSVSHCCKCFKSVCG